jgi:hypothetical protein
MFREICPVEAPACESLSVPAYAASPRSAAPRRSRSTSTFLRRSLVAAEVVIVGYLAFGRAFAHIGVAPAYPAELFLVASIFVGGGAALQLYLSELARGALVAVTMTAFLAWGLVEVARGIVGQYTFIESMRGLATHYYPLLFFVGWQLASRTDPAWFVAMLKRVSGLVTASGILVAALSHFAGGFQTLSLLLSPPAMPSYTAVGLLAFGPSLGALFYPLFGGNLVALLLNPGRASWVSLIVGIGIVLLTAGRPAIRRLLIMLGLLAVLLVTIGPLMPVAHGRGGDLSPRWIAARLVTLADPDLAEQMIAEDGSTSDVSDIRSISGTKEWRKRFWQATFDSLDAENLWLIGHGYGFSLGTLIHDEEVHTPHNFGVYLLGYTGYIGAALYVGLVLAFFTAIHALDRGPFRSFLFAQLAATLIVAAFGNALETPFLAVPFYLVMGLAYGFARSQQVCEWGPARA